MIMEQNQVILNKLQELDNSIVKQWSQIDHLTKSLEALEKQVSQNNLENVYNM